MFISCSEWNTDHPKPAPDPPFSPRSCSTRRIDALVIGSGLAGLVAAHQLIQKSEGRKSVVVLEASDSLGGRISAVKWHTDLSLNVGAHWVAGDGPGNPLHPLLEAACAESMAAASRCTVTNFEPQDVPMLGADGQPVVYDWEPLIQAFEKLAARAQDLEDMSLEAALLSVGWQPITEADYTALWFFVDYEWGSPPSATSLHHTVPAPYTTAFLSSNQRLVATDGGSPDLLKPLLQHVQPHVRLGERVVCVAQQPKRRGSAAGVAAAAADALVVTTVTDTGAVRTYTAETVIVTASLGVLASGSIRFMPPLPEDKARALARHQWMAQYEVVIAEFPYAFWAAHFPPGRTCMLYAGTPRMLLHDLSGYYGRPILEFHLAGDTAVRVSKQPLEQTKEQLMGILRAMYGEQDTPDAIRVHCTQWNSNPLTQGAFSVRPLGMTDAEHAALMRPCCNGRLHFAGDGLHPVHSGYMHAAYLSGLATADAVAAKWAMAAPIDAALVTTEPLRTSEGQLMVGTSA